jgi:tetratricopeptide (TPR) repeat protein
MRRIGFNRGHHQQQEAGVRGVATAASDRGEQHALDPTVDLNQCCSQPQRRGMLTLPPLRAALHLRSFGSSRPCNTNQSSRASVASGIPHDGSDTVSDAGSSTSRAFNPYKDIGDQCHFGASSFKAESVSEAIGYFNEALRLLSHVHCSSNLEASYVRSSVDDTIPLDFEDDGPLIGRNEYDEGMVTYEHVIDLQVDEIENSMVCGARPHSDFLYRHTASVLMFNIGHCHLKKKETDEAQNFFERSLVMAKLAEPSIATNGHHRHLYVMALHKIAQYFYVQGDYPEALKRFKTAFDIVLKNGNDSTSTDASDMAYSLNSLGVLYYHQGLRSPSDEKESRMETASDLLEEALRIRLRLSGKDHHDTATVLNNISRFCIHQKKHETALQGYAEALRIRKLVYGWKHIDVAATTYNLGQTHHLLGRHEHAMMCYKEFVTIATHLYGQNHKDIAMVLSLMAEMYQEQGERDVAMEYFRRALKSGIAAVGTEHSDIALLYNKMGTCLLEMGKIEDSIKAYEHGLDVEKRTLEPGHPNIFITLNNIGELYKQIRDFNGAKEYFSETMELRLSQVSQLSEVDRLVAVHLHGVLIKKPAQGADVPGIFDISPQLSALLRQAPRSDAWKSLYSSLAETVNDVADSFFKGGQDRLALKFLRHARALRVFAVGEVSKDVAITVHNIALIFQFMGKYDEALKCCDKSLAAMLELFGRNHEYVGMTQHLIGQLLMQRRCFEQALATLKEALDIQRTVKGTQDSSVARVLADIGKTCHELQDYEGMMSSFTEAARIYRLCGLSVDNLGIETQKMLAACDEETVVLCAPAA